MRKFTLTLLAIFMVVSQAVATTVTLNYMGGTRGSNTSQTLTTYLNGCSYWNVEGYRPTRAGFTFEGFYDSNNVMVWDADGHAVEGAYWTAPQSTGKDNMWKKSDASLTVYARWRDNVGFRFDEFHSGYNFGSDVLSFNGLSGNPSTITYGTYYQTNVGSSNTTRYEYSISLTNPTDRYLYAYMLLDYKKKVPAYTRIKAKLKSAQIHLYNYSSSVTKATSAFYVFDTETAARSAGLVCNASKTISKPSGGEIYCVTYNSITNATNGGGTSKNFDVTETVFDNSTGSVDREITKWAIFTTCAVSGYRHQKGFLLFNQSGGSYEDVTYEYIKYITFNPNHGKGEMAEQTVVNSANIKENTFTRDGFTFVGWNTNADGSGDSYTDKDEITATATSNGPVTLYAQWEPQTITVKFDYTYRSSESVGEETYVHMHDDDPLLTKKVKVFFRGHNNATYAEKILTAPAAVTPDREDGPTADITTHKTSTFTIDVVKGTGESVSLNPDGTTGSASYTLTLPATMYANYSGVEFEIMNADGKAAADHWAIDGESATSFIFKNEGHTSANMFDLTWRVNLKKLSMYPAHIYAKPMRSTASSTDYVQISVMQGIKGVECKLAGYIDAQGDDVTIEAYNALTPAQKAAFNLNGGAYYTGEYRVLKKDDQSQDFNYKLGLTGFFLDDNNYFLAATEGNIPNDMISTAEATQANVKITFDRLPQDIPVLILRPNGAGATVGGRTDYELYVDNNTNVVAGKRVVSLSKFEALRDNYELVGWEDAYDASETYGVDGVYEFKIGDKATTTLLAQWKRDSAPTVTYTIDETSTEEDGNIFKYIVTAIDALNDVQSVQYIITTTEDVPAEDATGWSNMDKQTDGTYTHTIPLFNADRGKFIWVKAANSDKSAIISMGKIRSILKLQGIQNPDSQEAKQIDEQTTIDLYDYYTTLFYNDHAFVAKDNVTAYTIENQAGQLKLVKIVPVGDATDAIIPAGTAVVLRLEQSTDNVIALEECDNTETTYPNNQLTGVNYDASPTANTDYYIFGYDTDNGMGFYLTDPSTLTLAAHTAFIKKASDAKNPTQYTLDFENQTVTGIDDIIVDGAANGAIYDLLGRKVKATNVKSGIYIKDGKKIFVK